MRIQTVLSVVLCFLFSFTQASEIKTQHTREVRKCQIQAIIEDVENFVNNTWDLFDEVYMSYKNMMVDAVKCMNDYNDTVSCVATVVTSWVETVSPEMEQYYVNLMALGEKFVDDLTSCS